MSRVSIRWRLGLGCLLWCAGGPVLAGLAIRAQAAEGTVNFNNFVPAAGIDAPVFEVDGVTRLAGTNYLAQLYGGLSANARYMKAAGSPVPFLAGEGAGYWQLTTNVVRGVPDTVPNMPAHVQVRVFDLRTARTFEEVVSAGGKAGVSDVLPLRLGGGGYPPPAAMAGLKSFALQQAPLLVQSPANGTADFGAPVEFRVVTEGSPLAYRWWKDGRLLWGATGATLRLPTADPLLAGRYGVTISNALNVLTGATARLTVLPSRVPGWLHLNNHAPEAGIDAPVFALDGVTRLAGTNYAAQLYAGGSPTAMEPVGRPVAFGDEVEGGYFDPATDLRRAVPFANAGGRVYAQVRVFDRRDGPSYEAVLAAGGTAGCSGLLNVVTGGEEGASAPPAPLVGLTSFALQHAVRVIAPPSDAIREARQSVDFTVALIGTAPTFQWQFQGANLVGATDATLVLTNLGCRMAGGYRVVVCNALNCVTSAPATLTVTLPTQAPQTGGTINFNSRMPAGGIDAPFTWRNMRLEGPDWVAQIYAGTNSTRLDPVGVPVPFRTGAAAGYINGGTVYVPNVPPGSQAFVQVRVWHRADGCSYEEAQQPPAERTLRSGLLNMLLGGTPDYPGPALLLGLQGASGPPEDTWVFSGPEDQAVLAGATVTFHLDIRFTLGGVHWTSPGQWQTDALAGVWQTIPEMTALTLVLTNVTTRDAGRYRVLTVSPTSFQTIIRSARLTVFDRPSLAPAVLPLADRRVRLRLDGPRFFEHVIEVSHDLRYWAELHRVLLTNDWMEIDDPLAGQGSSWFYRARVVP